MTTATKTICCTCCGRLFPSDAVEGTDYTVDSLGCPGCPPWNDCPEQAEFARRLVAEAKAAQGRVDSFGGIRLSAPPKKGSPGWEWELWEAMQERDAARARLEKYRPYLPPHCV